MFSKLSFFVVTLTVVKARQNEILSQEETEALGWVWQGNATDVSSHELLGATPRNWWHPHGETPAGDNFPREFTWCDVDGQNFCSMTRNQHIPQYCGACWAHGSVSALADRVKIARKGQGIDLNPSVQHILNCNGGGTCHGGSVDGPYQWLHRLSLKGSGISLESANPYMACSAEMDNGICGGGQWTCDPINIARTCGTFPESGGSCSAIEPYPMIQIGDYGSIRGAAAMQKEIYERGPISCGIDAQPIVNYTSGIADAHGKLVDHVVSVVGWGQSNGDNYWIVRNSWGEYWGDMGYIKVKFGALRLESQCSWAVPSYFTASELKNQVHCYEAGGCEMTTDKITSSVDK